MCYSKIVALVERILPGEVPGLGDTRRNEKGE